MTRLLALLGQLFLILVGYCAAAMAGSAFLHILLFGSAGFGMEQVPMLLAGSFIFSIPFVALFVAYFAFFPGLAFIVLGELLAIRSWIFYALGGGVAGLMVFFLIQRSSDQNIPDEYSQPLPEGLGDPALFAALLACGIVAGIAYWLVAGRSAGAWREPSRITAPER